MTGRLVGKKAFITGAASGIGRATAIKFAAEGAAIAVFDRNAAGLKQTAQEAATSGGKVYIARGDVCSETDVRAAVEAAEQTLSGLTTIAGIAGIELYNDGDTDVHELEFSVWQRTIDTNLTGMFLTLKHGIRALLNCGGGSVIVTGSPTGLYGAAAGETAYSASKAGCHGLARVAAHEYAQRGIRVNVLIPGFINTPINHRLMNDSAAAADVVGTIPMRRTGEAFEVAAMAAWLASDEASYATGGYFTVDGGQTSI